MILVFNHYICGDRIKMWQQYNLQTLNEKSNIYRTIEKTASNFSNLLFFLSSRIGKYLTVQLYQCFRAHATQFYADAGRSCGLRHVLCFHFLNRFCICFYVLWNRNLILNGEKNTRWSFGSSSSLQSSRQLFFLGGSSLRRWVEKVLSPLLYSFSLVSLLSTPARHCYRMWNMILLEMIRVQYIGWLQR